jgi:parallel beta helix pectate lyase-like protein
MPTRSLLGVALTLALLMAGARAEAAIFTVTTTNDSGPGSLRQAILNANANPGADTIWFAIGAGPKTISPLAALPTITDPVSIDGTKQPGYSGSPIIELDGSLAGLGVNGLTLATSSCVVQGLVIRGFQAQFLVGGGNAILVTTGGGHTIRSNFLGTDRTGSSIASNAGDGIQISSSSSNIIGGTDLSTMNLISGNGNGILILGVSDANVLSNNRIGTDRGGAAPLGNFGDGVVVVGGNANRVTQNLISGNGGNGVNVSGGATNTVVQGNRIGTNAAASAALANGDNGVQVSGSSAMGTQIGGDSAQGQGNTISGNGLNGVSILGGASGSHIEGNRIGTDGAGLLVLPNAANGVIVSSASGNFVGRPPGVSSGPQFANVICGNGTNGVRIRTGASGNSVTGNQIGLNANRIPAGNLGSGIQINDGATSNTVGAGGSLPYAANAVGGNVGDGILITDPATTGNVVQGNFIGTDLLGQPAGNGGNGVAFTASASNNSVGGIGAGDGNRIRNNSGSGVFVESGTGNAIRANSISANGGLGIDLAPPGVTANDHCDGDTGANQLMNIPVLLSAVSTGGGSVILQGALDSSPSSSYAIDFFANTGCDPSGNGEGSLYLTTTTVSTDATCAAPFVITLSSPTEGPIQSIAATATDGSGNTSEFSNCLIVPAAYYTLTPCRLIDTRGPTGPLGGPALSGGADRNFTIGGNCGVPSTATALAVNITVTQPTMPGHLRFYAGGDPLPPVSTINYSAGQTRANNAVVTLGPNGDFVVRCVQSGGTVQLIVDVVGYFE